MSEQDMGDLNDDVWSGSKQVEKKYFEMRFQRTKNQGKRTGTGGDMMQSLKRVFSKIGPYLHQFSSDALDSWSVGNALFAPSFRYYSRGDTCRIANFPTGPSTRKTPPHTRISRWNTLWDSVIICTTYVYQRTNLSHSTPEQLPTEVSKPEMSYFCINTSHTSY